MKKHDEINEAWESRINDLLDGELNAEEAADLRAEAENNAALAQAIIDAYALQASLDELEIERAPASLRKRLADIPRAEKKEKARWFGLPRWAPAGAMAAIPLLVVVMVMQPKQPEYTEAEVMQARQDLAVAFAYLDRIGERTSRHIQAELTEELTSGVNENVSRYMPYTKHKEQEENS